MTTQPESSLSTGLASLDTVTSEPLTGQPLNQLTLFAEAFHVSRTPLLVDAAELKTSAIFGPSLSAAFAVCNLDGSWRKTSQGFSQVTLDGSLELFSETWPRAGMTRSGTAYLQSPLVPLTDVIGYGSLPTPTVIDATMKAKGRRDTKGRHAVQLAQYANRGEWPTPRAVEWKDNAYQQKGDDAWLTLSGAARVWPTPTAMNSGGGPAMNKWGGSGARAKLRKMVPPSELNGALNPTWVEWLMGYPLGWTDLGDSAMPSSRKSRNGSHTGSKKRTPR